MVQISAGDLMMGALENDEDAYGYEKPLQSDLTPIS